MRQRFVLVDQPKLIFSRLASLISRRASSRAAGPYTGFRGRGGSSVRAFIRIGVGQPQTRTSGAPRPVLGKTRWISSVPSFAGYRGARAMGLLLFEFLGSGELRVVTNLITTIPQGRALDLAQARSRLVAHSPIVEPLRPVQGHQ